MLRILVGAALAACMVTAAIPASGDDACARARRELDSAREVLSSAVREADQAAAAYHACREARRPCGAERKASRTATAARKRAEDGFRFAAARVGQICR